MPYQILDLQLFADEGIDMAGADGSDTGLATSDVENPTEGVATLGEGEQLTTAQAEETWDSLIKGKYKKDYDKAVKAAVTKRFKNQQNLQSQIDSIDPLVRLMAQKYGVQANPDGSIPIDKLQAMLDSDDSMYEQEAFQRGMSVEDLKQLKQLERENQMLRRESQRTQEQRDWDDIVNQGNALKEMYPDFDLESEMENRDFGRLLATMRRSGFPDPVRTAYEAVHRDEIMGGAMRYAVSRTEQNIRNSIQANQKRPVENGVGKASPSTIGSIDPSKLTRAQLEDIKARAMRGERITF